MVHYGHSCLVPVDRTSGIKMLYVFVDIKIDPLHFLETVNFNFGGKFHITIKENVNFLSFFTTNF